MRGGVGVGSEGPGPLAGGGVRRRSVAADDEHAAHGGDLRAVLVGEVDARGHHRVPAGGADGLDGEGRHEPVPGDDGPVEGEGLLAVDHAGEVDPGGGVLDVQRLGGLGEGDEERGRRHDVGVPGGAGGLGIATK